MTSVRWAFNYSLWKPSKEEWLFASKCIQKEERERIGKFCFARDAKSSVIGRLMMRKYLSSTLGIPYVEVKLQRSDKGKPFLANPTLETWPLYDFNVSHQGSYSVFAADSCHKVGVDVMKIEYTGGKPLPDFFNLMQRQFSPAEWKFIGMPGLEKEQLCRFIRLWCLKESFVKAEGIGIGFDLQRVSFQCRTMALQSDYVVRDTCLFVDGKLADDWTFEESLISDDHCVAVALTKNTTASSTEDDNSKLGLFKHVDFKDITSNAIPFHEIEDETYWKEFAKKPEAPG